MVKSITIYKVNRRLLKTFPKGDTLYLPRGNVSDKGIKGEETFSLETFPRCGNGELPKRGQHKIGGYYEKETG